MTLLSFMEIEITKNYDFLNDKFVAPPKEIEDIFKVPFRREENYLIDVDNIVGTYHIDYQDNDFKIVCMSLKRKFRFKNFDVNDENYLKKLYGKKDPQQDYDWEIVIYKGKGYIHGGGNHRTISAKLLAKCGKIPNKIYIPVAFIVENELAK